MVVVTGAGAQLPTLAVRTSPTIMRPAPAMVGTPAVTVPIGLAGGGAEPLRATGGVAGETADTEVNPRADPVTRTVITLPRCFWVSLSLRLVETFAVPAYHLYENVRSVGLHWPMFTRRVVPSTAAPEMAGWPALIDPAVTGAVGCERAVRARRPALLPVIATLICRPTSAVVRRYLLPVAPPMMLPSRSHWYAKVTPAGFHVPAVAVSVSPTTAVPVTAGVGPVMVAWPGAPRKWMNCVG